MRRASLTTILALCLGFIACGQRGARQPVVVAFDPGGRDPILLSGALMEDVDRVALTSARCARVSAARVDVLTLVFSHRLDFDSIAASDFEIELADGATLTPPCAMRLPTPEPLEAHTVLLLLPARGDGAEFSAVSLSGSVRSEAREWGQLDFIGQEVSILQGRDGPSLLLGERVMLADSSCSPSISKQAVRLTWTHPMAGAPKADPARFSITMMDRTGALSRVTPSRLEDMDDGDNYSELCIDNYNLPLEVHLIADSLESFVGSPNARQRVDVAF